MDGGTALYGFFLKVKKWGVCALAGDTLKSSESLWHMAEDLDDHSTRSSVVFVHFRAHRDAGKEERACSP